MADREHHSVSVRKIDNGWIESRSVSKGDSYKHTEHFHPKKPAINVGGASLMEGKTVPGASSAAMKKAEGPKPSRKATMDSGKKKGRK